MFQETILMIDIEQTRVHIASKFLVEIKDSRGMPSWTSKLRLQLRTSPSKVGRAHTSSDHMETQKRRRNRLREHEKNIAFWTLSLSLISIKVQEYIWKHLKWSSFTSPPLHLPPLFCISVTQALRIYLETS